MTSMFSSQNSWEEQRKDVGTKTVYPVDNFTLTDTSDFRKAKNSTKNLSEYMKN